MAVFFPPHKVESKTRVSREKSVKQHSEAEEDGNKTRNATARAGKMDQEHHDVDRTI